MTTLNDRIDKAIAMLPTWRYTPETDEDSSIRDLVWCIKNAFDALKDPETTPDNWHHCCCCKCEPGNVVQDTPEPPRVLNPDGRVWFTRIDSQYTFCTDHPETVSTLSRVMTPAEAFRAGALVRHQDGDLIIQARIHHVEDTFVYLEGYTSNTSRIVFRCDALTLIKTSPEKK